MWRMPALSGWRHAPRAKIDATLPVLLVTAYADHPRTVGAMPDGALNYLAKPIDLGLNCSRAYSSPPVSEAFRPVHYPKTARCRPTVIAQSPVMQSVFPMSR